MTPVVWLALDQTAQQIVTVAVDSATGRARSRLRALLRRPAEAVTVPPLIREQLVEVHNAVVEMAVQRGLEEGRAAVIADAVVARLVLGEREDPGPAESVAEADSET
ncbi:hypothetical protein ACFYY2_03995 [Streptomyces sp. NPDC001822]|uniref:hypothetical protein n=1 Tax=Streptomyces sp. NPDC001822 TaxID=3364614 RepID=UPI00368D1769